MSYLSFTSLLSKNNVTKRRQRKGEVENSNVLESSTRVLNVWKEIPDKERGRSRGGKTKRENAQRQSSFSRNSCICFIEMKMSVELCFLHHLHPQRPQRDGSCTLFFCIEMNRSQDATKQTDCVLLGPAAKTNTCNICVLSCHK